MVRPGFRQRRFPRLALGAIFAGIVLMAVGLVLFRPETAQPASGDVGAPQEPVRAVDVLAEALRGARPAQVAPTPAPNDTLIRSFVSLSSGGGLATPARRGIVTYTVESGDTLFGIAGEFGVSPESVLWSNYKTLRDNPDLLSIGQELVIPPENGVIVVVEVGDTVTGIARRFKINESALVGEPLNQLRSASQALTTGAVLFAPGGQRETIVWELPKLIEVATNAAGVKVYRVGVCGEVAIPRLGTGAFGFPASSRYLSGYNFSNLHPGLDFAGRLGDPIYAADAGTVIFAGYSLNAAGAPVGYGQYVVVDHGNGFQTLYAHASQLFVRCGQQVAKGAQIAAIGSVGKSTGPHLHFELRLGGAALNPWTRLPPP